MNAELLTDHVSQTNLQQLSLRVGQLGSHVARLQSVSQDPRKDQGSHYGCIRIDLKFRCRG